ncbi:hypothetical protein AN901_203109 [Pseudomonas syringae pv. theae]|nr:hypothetical protein AN901_203109 [Pseudomonas syringae pv. theae]
MHSHHSTDRMPNKIHSTFIELGFDHLASSFDLPLNIDFPPRRVLVVSIAVKVRCNK